MAHVLEQFPKQALIANVTNVVFSFATGLVSITWTGAGTSYKVSWRLRDELDWHDMAEVTTPAIDIAGTWIFGKIYEFKFVSLAGGRETIEDIFGFTIPSGKAAPTSATVARIGATTDVKLTWSGDPADIYMVGYGEIGTPQDEYTVVQEVVVVAAEPAAPPTVNNVTLPGFDLDKHYDFRLFKVVNDEMIPYTESTLQI